MGLGEQRVDQRFAASELKPQDPGVGHHLEQPFPAGPVHARELLFAKVTMFAVVIAAEVQFVAGAGVPVSGFRPHQDHSSGRAAGQVDAPPGTGGFGEPGRERRVGGRVSQFGVAGGADPECAVIAGADDDVAFGVGAGDELVRHVRLRA